MGCRPSRNSLGRVADSTNEYNRCYLNDFDKARRKQKRNVSRDRRKTPTYSQFSSTSRTYDLQSRMSRITVRLSTDGSMLEIEQCDLDMIREGRADVVSEYSTDANSDTISDRRDSILNTPDVKCSSANTTGRCDSASILRSIDETDSPVNIKRGKKSSVENTGQYHGGESSLFDESKSQTTKKTSTTSSYETNEDSRNGSATCRGRRSTPEHLDNQYYQINDNETSENNNVTMCNQLHHGYQTVNGLGTNSYNMNRCAHKGNNEPATVDDTQNCCQSCVTDSNANVLSPTTRSVQPCINHTPKCQHTTPKAECDQVAQLNGMATDIIQTQPRKPFDSCPCVCSQCNIIMSENLHEQRTVRATNITTCGTITKRMCVNLTACCCITSGDSPKTAVYATPTRSLHFQYCKQSILQTDNTSCGGTTNTSSKHLTSIGNLTAGERRNNVFSDFAQNCHVKNINDAESCFPTNSLHDELVTGRFT